MSTTGSLKGMKPSAASAAAGTSASASRRSQNPEGRLSESSTASTSNTSLNNIIAPPIMSVGSADHDADRRMDTFEWDIDSELVFYKLLISIRPVGVNRHFNMMLIYDKFIKELNRDPNTIHVDDLWKKLDTLYDLDGLQTNPDSMSELDCNLKRAREQDEEFALPTKEFAPLMRDRLRQLSPSPTQIGGGSKVQMVKK